MGLSIPPDQLPPQKGHQKAPVDASAGKMLDNIKIRIVGNLLKK